MKKKIIHLHACMGMYFLKMKARLSLANFSY